MKKKKNKKSKIITVLSLLVLFSVLCVSLSSCGGKAPELESVYDRFVYLIEESKEINQLFFGVGEPTYKRDSNISDKKMIYQGLGQSQYEYFMENSKFLTVDMMKTAAEKVYSDEYIASVYETAFDGVSLDGGVAYVRYYEDADWIYQSTYVTPLIENERMYDYSSMEIVKPSNASYVNVQIDSYTLNDPENVSTITLSFIYENGNWYLDTPTY